MIEKTRAEILSIIPFDECICIDDINAQSTFSVRTVYRYLKQLAEDGLIERTKNIRDMRKIFYRRIEV